MEDFAVLAAGISIVWLVFWLIRFDRSKSIADHRGPFRMRADAPQAGARRRLPIGAETGLDRQRTEGPS